MIPHLIVDPLLKAWLAEDLPSGDITGAAIFTDKEKARAAMVAREEMVVAGVESLTPRIFALIDPSVMVVIRARDGERVNGGTVIAEISGPTAAILAGERLALNLAMRLSGIATMTAAFVAAVTGTRTKILDTRKTTPGLRILEKYAVRRGGGSNHRMNLSDGVLIKDNHIAACGSIAQAVERVRERVPHTMKIEVECDSLSQVEEALAAGAEIIMLDNMAPAEIRQGIELIGGRALSEASGSMTLDRVREVAECGVDFISVGGLTHSAPAVDIGLDMITDNR